VEKRDKLQKLVSERKTLAGARVSSSRAIFAQSLEVRANICDRFMSSNLIVYYVPASVVGSEQETLVKWLRKLHFHKAPSSTSSRPGRAFGAKKSSTKAAQSGA
jgi:hypothetical protein